MYMLLFALPFPLNSLPVLSTVGALYAKTLIGPIEWFQRNVLHIMTERIEMTGSGDTTFNYVQILVYAIVSVTGCIIWTLLDKKRKNYDVLSKWLRFYIRLFLGSVLIMYGGCKLVPAQFGTVRLTQLTQSYGESSPMGLLWTFMAASQPYTMFTGLTEMLAGVLLYFAGTTTLGALLSVAVFTNVFMLNLAYDVPVKLYSLHFLLLSMFLVLPDTRGLLNFFVFRKPAAAKREEQLFRRRSLNIATVAVETLAAVYLCSTSLIGSYFSVQQSAASKHSLYGIWSVSDFKVDGTTPPQQDAPDRWRLVIFDFPESTAIQMMGNTREWLESSANAKTGEIILKSYKGNPKKQEFYVRKLAADQIEVSGTALSMNETHKIEAKLHRINEGDFELLKRGFRWVSEYPYNR